MQNGMSTELPSTSSMSSQQPDDNRPKPNICRICGDRARFSNYGVLSCLSCKTFFRRNGSHPQSVRPCSFKQPCDINMQSRHSCTACRLAKCLGMGMSADLIRKVVRKRTKKSLSSKESDASQQVIPNHVIHNLVIPNHVIPNQVTTVARLPTLNLLQDDRSRLLGSQWTLLSNIVHAYDTYTIAPQIRRVIDDLSKVPARIQSDSINLLETVGQMYTSMQSFISSSPDFQILTVNEKASLVDRNLDVIVGFCSTLFFRETDILRCPAFCKAVEDVYTSDTTRMISYGSERLDPDSTVCKLILLIFAFSSTSCIITEQCKLNGDGLLNGTFRLFGSQNVYVDVLWKYMIYRYGYDQSTLRFARLIQTFLCAQSNMANIYANNQVHQAMVADITDKIKKSLILREHEQTVLWGKKS